MKNSGLIHIFYGSGEGKTSAATGVALRMCGSGGRVVFAQFLKDGTSSELAALRQQPGISLCCAATARGMVYTMNQQEKEQTARNCRRRLQEAFATAQEADLLVLDEVIDACCLEVLELRELLVFLDNRPEGLEVILTGHSLPLELEKRGDYITHMQSQRHPFDRGVPARRGIEF